MLFAALLPYLGLLSAALGAFAWLRDFRSEVNHIRTNALPHILEATEAQTHELREIRADFRTYFAPHPSASAPVTITVSPVNSNVSEQHKAGV